MMFLLWQRLTVSWKLEVKVAYIRANQHKGISHCYRRSLCVSYSAVILTFMGLFHHMLEQRKQAC